MSNQNIDFIVVNYNTFDFVKLLVKSIDCFVDFDFKIYIIDTSDQLDLLSSYYANRKDIIVKGKKFTCDSTINNAVCNHIGGVNYGFDLGDSELVCILDPDTIFMRNWVSDLLPLLENNSFVSNRFEPAMNIARPQMMFFKRKFWIDNSLKFENYKDTGGNITRFCQQNQLKFFVLDNSYNNKDLVSQHIFPDIHCEQCFINNLPFFMHQGRGASQGDRSKWMTYLSDFLSISQNSKVYSLLKNVKNKDESKSTTTLKFKKDIIDFILGNPQVKGNILEIGTNKGYTTVILAKIAEILNRKVFSFEIDDNLLDHARKLCQENSITNCEIIKKDVYRESWDLQKEFGYVFIDAIHSQKAFRKDLRHAEEILLEGGYIIAHDYGLSNSHGRPIYQVLSENKDKYEIVKFIGEKDGWNKLGTGGVFDYEAVIIKIKGNPNVV